MSSPAKGRRARGGHEEEHENHERWLVTYADMVTLLMVLFIVMFAMSQVDQKKFNELKTGLAAGFGTSESVLTGSESVLDQPGSASVESMLPQTTAGMSPRDQAMVDQAVQLASAQREQRRYAEALAEADRLQAVARRVHAALRRRGLLGDVRATIDERGLVLSLVSRHVVFEPDLAELSARGREVVDTLAPVLRELPDPLQVDGHTNQVPVEPKYYPTDWELSSARAITVLRHLVERWELPEGRLRASAFGSEKPLVDPGRRGSQAVNKRVDIVVLSGLASESRALLESAVRDRRPGRGEAVVADEPVLAQPAADRPAPAPTTAPTQSTQPTKSLNAEGAHR